MSIHGLVIQIVTLLKTYTLNLKILVEMLFLNYVSEDKQFFHDSVTFMLVTLRQLNLSFLFFLIEDIPLS